jgi:hypothetical protein
MITLKAQLCWARVKRWIALGVFALGSILPNHPRDDEAERQRKLSLSCSALCNLSRPWLSLVSKVFRLGSKLFLQMCLPV